MSDVADGTYQPRTAFLESSRPELDDQEGSARSRQLVPAPPAPAPPAPAPPAPAPPVPRAPPTSEEFPAELGNLSAWDLRRALDDKEEDWPSIHNVPPSSSTAAAHMRESL